MANLTLTASVTPIDQVKIIKIASGQTISDYLDCQGLRVAAMQFGLDWVDAATITIGASADNVAYDALIVQALDSTILAQTIVIAGGGLSAQYLQFDTSIFYGVRYLVLSAASSVAYDRYIKVVLRTY